MDHFKGGFSKQCFVFPSNAHTHNIDAKNVLEKKLKNVKKLQKRGKNKKKMIKNVSLNLFNFLPKT